VNLLDAVVLGVMLLAALLGGWKGLIYEFLYGLNWVCAYLLAQWVGPWLGQYVPGLESGSPWGGIIAWVLVFVATAFVGGWLAHWASSVFDKAGLRPVDRLLGAVLGVVFTAVVLLALTVVLHMTSVPEQGWWKESMVVHGCEEALRTLKPLLPSLVTRYLN
jgi:membrane protein required for colicin V production